jgi:hypothetical protein
MNATLVPPPALDYEAALAAAKKGYPLGGDIFLPTREKHTDEQRYRGLLKSRDCLERRYPLVYRPRLEKLREWCSVAHTCVIIGNGPSLKHVELDTLQHVPTFAANGIYLAYPGTRFRPTFHVIEDHLVAEDRADDLNQLRESIKLFPTYLAYCLEDDGATIFYRHLPRPNAVRDRFDFSPNAAEQTYTGCTVTFSNLQLAYYLGFRRILLIGLDHNYTIPKDVKVSADYKTGVLDMKSDDPNHFNKDYFGKGKRWHDPQVNKMDAAYVCAREFFKQNGVEVFNCTVGGKLEVFPRRPLTECLAEIPAHEAVQPKTWLHRLRAANPPPVTARLEILPLDLRERFAEEFATVVRLRGKRPIGWHYLLDLTWLLAHVRRNVPLGSLILDAGAGSGLAQFLLMDAGYRVLSVDMAPRSFSPRLLKQYTNRVFQVEAGATLTEQSAAYLAHLEKNFNLKEQLELPKVPLAAAFAPGTRPGIFVVQGDLLDLSWLENHQVDGVISCSALEHNGADAVRAIVSSLAERTRTGGWHFHTVAATQDEDFFHEPSKGWAYTAATAKRLWGLDSGCPDNYAEFDALMRELRVTPNFLERSLATFYFQSGANGMPWGHWDPQYLPLGITRQIR